VRFLLYSKFVSAVCCESCVMNNVGEESEILEGRGVDQIGGLTIYLSRCEDRVE